MRPNTASRLRSRSLAWSSRSREHALTRLTRAEGADGHGDGAGNVTLHRSDSLHSTSHVAEPAEGSVRPHPLLAGELIDHSLSQQQNRRHRLIIKRNLTGEQGKSTTTPGTSPRRNSNQRNLDPEAQRNLRPKNLGAAEEPHRLIIKRNLTGSRPRLAAPRRNPRQETPRGSPRQKVRRDTSGEGTLVVRRSQARGRMASQPHTNHHARAKADRQTDRQNRQQPPHRSDTSAGESPTQRYAVVPPYRPTHQGGAFVRCPPYGT